MTVNEVLLQLEALGNDQTKKVLTRHGAKEPFFGVKVSDLKPIQKKIKVNHQLSLDLYNTGNSDAMYLAGLIADVKQITPEILNEWIEKAYWYMLSEYTVAWVASESAYGWEIGNQWIKSSKESIASAGWSTLSNCLLLEAYKEKITLDEIGKLLEDIEQNIHQCQNRVKYTMNGFVIAAGAFSTEMMSLAIEVGSNIGKVDVYMGQTSCKVPDAVSYIQKMEQKGKIGSKKKKARC